jgi:hypothetical protein
MLKSDDDDDDDLQQIELEECLSVFVSWWNPSTPALKRISIDPNDHHGRIFALIHYNHEFHSKPSKIHEFSSSLGFRFI